MSETKLDALNCSDFIQIGWIAHGMHKTRTDNYKAMFGNGKVRVPPKIYHTEAVANRYGQAVPVFVRNQNAQSDHTTKGGC